MTAAQESRPAREIIDPGRTAPALPAPGRDTIDAQPSLALCSFPVLRGPHAAAHASRPCLRSSRVVVLRQPLRVLALLALFLAAVPAHALTAVPPEVIRGFAGVVKGVPDEDAYRPQGTNTPNVVTLAYDDLSSPVNFGLSSTDLAAEWGDRTYLTSSGLLSSHKLTIFNSATNGGGPLLTAQVGVDFYDGGTNAFIGGYIVDANFGAGLPTGYYAVVSVTDLEPWSIDLPSDVRVVQRVISFTGAANRLGIASFDPVTIGASPVSMYIFASTFGGGIAGYYVVASGPANPGYQVGLAQATVGTSTRTWGQLKKLYR